MNCPNCGAENEAGARFCVECGAPLESQVELPVNPPEFDEDDDRTILSTNMSRLAEEAKTMAVTQDQLAAAEAEASSSSSWQSSPEPPPPPSAGAGSGGASGLQGLMTQRNIIIAVVVIILLCCCCCALGVVGRIASDPNSFENMMRDLSSLPLRLWVV